MCGPPFFFGRLSDFFNLRQGSSVGSMRFQSQRILLRATGPNLMGGPCPDPRHYNGRSQPQLEKFGQPTEKKGARHLSGSLGDESAWSRWTGSAPGTGERTGTSCNGFQDQDVPANATSPCPGPRLPTAPAIPRPRPSGERPPGRSPGRCGRGTAWKKVLRRGRRPSSPTQDPPCRAPPSGRTRPFHFRCEKFGPGPLSLDGGGPQAARCMKVA